MAQNKQVLNYSSYFKYSKNHKFEMHFKQSHENMIIASNSNIQIFQTLNQIKQFSYSKSFLFFGCISDIRLFKLFNNSNCLNLQLFRKLELNSSDISNLASKAMPIIVAASSCNQEDTHRINLDAFRVN